MKNPASLGKIAPNPAVATRATANYPELVDLAVNTVGFQALGTNTGNVLIGVSSAMNATTLADVIYILAPGAFFCVTDVQKPFPHKAGSFWVLPEVAGEGCLVTTYQR
jgi:hypothetical protein